MTDWLTDWQLGNQKFTLHEKPPHIYDHPEKWPYQRGSTLHGPLTRYVKFRVAHAPGISWTFSPPPRVSDPVMHYGTCVTHVPLCMPGSLTRGFLWSRWRGKRSRHSRRMRNPQFYVSGKRPMMKGLSWTGDYRDCVCNPLIDSWVCSSRYRRSTMATASSWKRQGIAASTQPACCNRHSSMYTWRPYSILHLQGQGHTSSKSHIVKVTYGSCELISQLRQLWHCGICKITHGLQVAGISPTRFFLIYCHFDIWV